MDSKRSPPPVEQFDGGIAGWPGEVWHQYGCNAAQREGWDLFVRDDNHELEIEVIAEPWELEMHKHRTQALWPDDGSVIRHCFERASGGSRVHLLALYLDGRIHESRAWVPTEWLPAGRP